MNRRDWLAVTAGLALAGCSPDQPVRIGFIGGLSDRGSDVGEGGRNALMLAVEQRNQAGGIKGRKIELVVQDDGQNPEKATAAVGALVAAKVQAVVGPFTSAMSAVLVPQVNQARLVLISPTVTGTAFVGKDDYFIRINSAAAENAHSYAQQMYRRGQRRVAVAYDMRNLSYTGAWLEAFRARFVALGGRLAVEVPFESQSDTAFSQVMRKLLAARPDGLLFIATAVDTARLAQQGSKMAPGLPMGTSEWSGSDALIELGGSAVEGMLVAQSYNRDDSSPRYRQFHDLYQARFGRVPGYSAVNAYDAAIVLFEAMSRMQGSESLKEAVLKYGPYDGLQQSIQFDRFGDTPRQMFFTEIRGGRFVLLK